MGKVISIVNNKGGVAKTTTAFNLSCALSRLGKRVLMIDLDPQSSLTIYCGLEPLELKKSIYDVLTNHCEAKDALMNSPIEGTVSYTHLQARRCAGSPAAHGSPLKSGRQCASHAR